MTACRPEELLIVTIADLLAGCEHVAVGVLSPVPGAAALLHRARAGGRVSILGSREPAFRIGSIELFDCAAQGRIDAFFLSGGQIDGQGNVNLVGIGDYPRLEVRWSGSFGSAFLYHLVSRVILFRDEHTRRALVPRVDFVSAAGISPPGEYRPGGPHALVTERCRFTFDRSNGRFQLASIHPGHNADEVRAHTGFDYDTIAPIIETPAPTPEVLRLLRSEIAPVLGRIYPRFTERVFGAARAA